MSKKAREDAKNLDGAYAWLNYIMDPKVIADVSNKMNYANVADVSIDQRQRSFIAVGVVHLVRDIRDHFWIHDV
jgi:hypothetical protein